MRTIILDRNPSITNWLKAQGVSGELVSTIGFREALNNHIYGPCALGLACVASQVSMVRMPRLDALTHKRYISGELSVEEMTKLGAHLRTYTVQQVGGPGHH